MNLTVLDLTRLLPGGYATALLQQQGARIIKVEDPNRGDYLRDFPFPLEDGMSAYFHALNRGKESVVIDLKADPEPLLHLVETADVLMESFRPGVMDRLGAGYAAASARNPRIVYCSISAFGSDGPERDRPGHDLSFAARSGFLALNRTDDDTPALPGIQAADLASAFFAVIEIQHALLARASTGRGQFIDVSMMQSMNHLMTFGAAPWQFGMNPERHELLLHGGMPCYALYRTSDGWIAVANLEEKFWSAFCTAIGHPDWIARQWDMTLKRQVEDVMRTRSRAEWTTVLRGVDTCVEPVLSLDEAVKSHPPLPEGAPPRRGGPPHQKDGRLP